MRRRGSSGGVPVWRERDVAMSRHRKLALTAHVVTSVGWLGAVASSLALAAVAFASDDFEVVAAAYPAMDLIARYVLVPLGLATLLTGVVQSLTTQWGLVRHYWVVIKLAISIVTLAVLLAYTETLRDLAEASRQAGPGTDPGELTSGSALLHAIGGLVLLLAATAMSVFKPKGLTRHGQRRQRGGRSGRTA